MMRMCLMVLLFSLIACKENPKANNPKNTKPLTELDWLLGKWKNENTGELELWSKKQDSFFGGMMVEVNENDKAVIKEVLSLEGRKDGIFYIAKINGKTRARKVEFKMSNTNFTKPTFSNLDNEFPQHISYMKIGANKIKVELEGTGASSSSFYYIRDI